MLAGLVVLLTLTAAGLLVVRSRAFQVVYHDRQMHRAWRAQFTKPELDKGGIVGYTVRSDNERYEYHRARLLELSAILELDYEFRHIKQPSDEESHLMLLIMSGEAADCIDFASPYPSEPEPMRLSVWCYPDDKTDWDRLVQTRDVPDYRSRFTE